MYYPRFTKELKLPTKLGNSRNMLLLIRRKPRPLKQVEEPCKQPTKKPATKKTCPLVGFKPRTPPVCPSAKKKRHQLRLKEAKELNCCDSSKGANLESEEPDEPKDKSIDTNSDEEDDEFVHTPEDYVPTDDEDVNDEEFDRINKEMYSDVNMELKDSKRKGEGKDDEEMTDVGQVDAEHEEVSQEVAGDQVKDDAQATVIVALATQKTEVPLQSSSISSDYATKFLNFDNIPSVTESSTAPATTITSLFSSLFPNLQQSTPIPSPTTTEATTSPLILTICATVKSEVPNVVKEYIGTSLDDALHKVLQRYTAKLIKKHFIPADVTDVLQ
ncbi:hypothetical protein Tco_1548281 [Tanacetum coccineum]